MDANDKQVGGTHYKPGSRYMHWDFCVENNLGYLEGQVTKYLARWRQKNGRQDLEKAEHYAAKLVERGSQRCMAKPYYRAARFYQVKGLPEMTALYRLTPAEQDVFRLVAEYQTLEQLNAVQRLIKEMLNEVTP